MACGIFVPQSGVKPIPLLWKCEVLITRPLGKSRLCILIIIFRQLDRLVKEAPQNGSVLM